MHELKKKGRTSCRPALQRRQADRRGSHVLWRSAARRIPAILGCASGHRDDERGYIKVDDECRTDCDGVLGARECNGRGAFTHTSYNDYEIVAANLFDNDKRRISAASRLTHYPSTRRSGAPDDRRRSQEKRQAVLLGKDAHDARGRRGSRGNTGFMKVLVDADPKELLRRGDPRQNGDEVVHFAARHDVRQTPLHDDSARDAHPPDVSELIPTPARTAKSRSNPSATAESAGGASQRLAAACFEVRKNWSTSAATEARAAFPCLVEADAHVLAQSTRSEAKPSAFSSSICFQPILHLPGLRAPWR